MPTVLREAGFEVRIYTADHPPAHVHVEKAGAVLKIDLATAKVVRIVGAISDRDVKRGENIVEKHAAALKEAWRKLHGHK
jgi:hypothetical protein